MSLACGCGQEGHTASAGTGAASTSSASSSGSGGSGGAPVDPVAYRIGNWNVHNFVNDQNDSDADQEEYQSATAYTAQRAAIAAVIDELGPDVMMFAELENQAVLDDLVAELGGGYAGLAVTEGNDPRAINIAAISREPFADVVMHKDDSFTVEGTTGPSFNYSRDCLELHLDVNGRRVILLGVHYKAKDAMDDGQKRLAEAQHTRALADALAEAHPGAAILILGDYNDLPNSPPYVATVGEEPDLYTDAADQVAAGDRWTFDYNGSLELVDHQMANPLLYGLLDPASVSIRHGADVDDASDHAPIIATYQVK